MKSFHPCKMSYLIILLIFFALLIPNTRNIFLTGGYRWLYILLLSSSLSFILTPLLRHIAKKRRILDYPDDRKVHHKNTPLLGGAAVYMAFIGSICSNNIYTTQLVAILIGGSFIFTISIIDDIKEVSAGLKLVIHILATCIIIGSGIVLNLFPNTPFGLVGNVFLTFLWVVGITNSFNFFDGMDGLATGLGIITSFFIGIVAFQTNQPFIGWIAIAIMGSCMGFLPYNFRSKRPASIFLGDAGSNFLGFILASLAILSEWADNNPIVSVSTPLLIFWIFIFDMIYITIARITSQRVRNFREWIDYVGKDHLHHRLEALLTSKRQSVFFIFFLCACMGLSAIVLRQARTVDAILLLVQAAIIVSLVTILEVRANNRRE